MERDKEHFRHLLLYYFDLKKRLSKLTDLSQKFILSLLQLHQLKHVSTGFDNSKMMILIWKAKNIQVNQKRSKI